MTNSDITSLLAECFTNPLLRVAVTPMLRGVTSSQLFEIEKVAKELLCQPGRSSNGLHKETEALMYLIVNLFSVLGIPLARVSQEITAIMAGTIDASDSSLAAKLNISNAQVRDWNLEGSTYVNLQLIKRMIQYFK